MNVCRWFIPRSTGLIRPITDKLKVKASKFVFTGFTEDAFLQPKQVITNTVSLTHPDQVLSISMLTDTSVAAVGTTLKQTAGNTKQPVIQCRSNFGPMRSDMMPFSSQFRQLNLAFTSFAYPRKSRLHGLHLSADHFPMHRVIPQIHNPPENLGNQTTLISSRGMRVVSQSSHAPLPFHRLEV